MTRAEAIERARRCLRIAEVSDSGIAVAYYDEAEHLQLEHDIVFEDIVTRPRRGPALTLLTAGRISGPMLAEVRAAICDAVRRAALRREDPHASEDALDLRLRSARWRRGSNSWRPNGMRILRDARIPETPCPNCGAPGEGLAGGEGFETCTTCHRGFAVGDYDRQALKDCLRFAADLDAGLVEPTDRCARCDRVYDQALHDIFVNQVEPFCASPDCPFGGDLQRHDGLSETPGGTP